MARSADQIAEDLALSINQTDSSWDTDQGPIPDLFIRPVAGQINLAEVAAEELRLLFSLQFSEVATESEIRDALRNYGSAPGVGQRASHIQFFQRFTRPTSDIVIPVGTLVSNSTGDLVYRTLNAITMFADSAERIFNADRGVYEVSTRVEAAGFGDEFELPAFRVNTLLTNIPEIEVTENRTRSRGGTPEEGIESQADRLRNSLPGINLNSPGGILKRITNQFPGRISDVSTVKTSDPEFTRIIDKPSLDVYILGTEPETFRRNFQASGGQTAIALNKVPVLDVVSVTVNDSDVSFEFIPDDSKETQKSLESSDIIKVDPLLPTDQVEVTYNYNKLLEDVNTFLNDGDEFLFEVDYLIRSPIVVPPVLEIEIKTLPSYDFENVRNNISERLDIIFAFTKFEEMKTPREVKDNILGNVSGIRGFKWIQFRRSSGSLSNIEPIIYKKNEISEYDPSLITIKTVR